MAAITGFGVPQTYQAQSFIDSKLFEARVNQLKYPSNGVIHFADTWFNLKNDQPTAPKIPDEVKWQIFFASTACIKGNGEIFLGENFSIEHLNIKHLTLLFDIFTAYNDYEKTQYQGQYAIFHKHVKVIRKAISETLYSAGLETNQLMKECDKTLTKMAELIILRRDVEDTSMDPGQKSQRLKELNDKHREETDRFLENAKNSMISLKKKFPTNNGDFQ